MAAILALPASAAASDGATTGNSGGGTTYYETPPAPAEISLRVASGAWLGRRTRIRGRATELAGRTVAIERRRSRRGDWVPVKSVRVGENGRFGARWRPGRAGRHQLRALAVRASSAESTEARTASAVKRVTVYERLTATWYGPGFYGNRTACGQRLKRSTHGVAHRTLPCGAKVAIRVNGRSAVVPVIDRGPYANGASYDLTSATARALGVASTVRIGAAVLTR